MECVDVRWMNSIKMGLRVIGFVEVDWIPQAENNNAANSCCEYGNVPCAYVKGLHALDKQHNSHPFNKDVALQACRLK